MNKVVTTIEAMRKQKGVTKTHIAKHCNKTVAWYADIAKGRRRVYLDDVLLIAEALQTDAKNFFNEKLSVSHNRGNSA